jgi:hypothetical protein
MTRISVGELLQKTATAIHMELNNIRLTMRARDPELRTKALRAFVSKTLKKLAQLYAICKWVDAPGVRGFFESISYLESQVKNVEGQLTEIQDRIFWMHSFMYWMRSRRLEVELASQIMATGTYEDLPEAIFTCGRDPVPGGILGAKLEGEARERVIDELSTFIRCKVGLSDPLPVGLSHAHIAKGCLHMRRGSLYEAVVSLDGLSDEADWVTLKTELLVESHPKEHFEGGFMKPQIEAELLAVLRKHATSVRDPKAADRARKRASLLSTVDGVSTQAQASPAMALKEEVVIKEEPEGKGGSKPAVAIKEEPKTMDVEKEGTGESSGSLVDVAKQERASFNLVQIDAVCRHVALAAVHRYLYVQALDMSMNLWKGALEAEFTEGYDSISCKIRFWKSKFSHQYQYELCISQSRYNKELDKEGKVERCSQGLGSPLVGTLSALVISSGREAGYQAEPVPRSAEVPELQIRHYYESGSSEDGAGGVSMGSLLNSVLWILGSTRLDLLHARLHASAAFGLDTSGQGQGGRVQVTKTASIVCLCVLGTRLDLSIDVRSGEYCVKFWHAACSRKRHRSGGASTATISMAQLSSSVQSNIKLFLAEANNLETQHDQRDCLLRDGIQGMAESLRGKTRPLATAEAVLGALLLADWEVSLLLSTKDVAALGERERARSLGAGASSVLPTAFVAKAAGIELGEEPPLYAEYCLQDWRSVDVQTSPAALPCFATARDAAQNATILEKLRTAVSTTAGADGLGAAVLNADTDLKTERETIKTLRIALHEMVSGKTQKQAMDNGRCHMEKLAASFKTGGSDLGLFLVNVMQRVGATHASPVLSMDNFTLKPHLLLVKFSAGGEIVAASSATTGGGFGQGGGYKKKKGKTQHLTAGQLAAQKAKQEEEKRKVLETSLNGVSSSGNRSREPLLLKHQQVSAPTATMMALCSNQGNSMVLSEASKKILTESLEQAKALLGLVESAPQLGEAGLQKTVTTEGEGEPPLHVVVLPSRDAAAVTFSTMYDNVDVDVGTAVFTLVPLGGGKVAIRLRCFTYSAEAPESENLVPRPSYYAIVASALNSILGQHAPIDASSGGGRGMDAILQVASQCAKLISTLYALDVQYREDARILSMRACDAAKIHQVADGAKRASFSVVNPHEISHLYCLQPLSVEGAQGQGGVITATTHATVFENDGLATKVLSSHIGGVVRLSLDARGTLTVTEGLVSGLFSGQPVPSLDSAESTRSFVSSLLEKQGLRGL